MLAGFQYIQLQNRLNTLPNTFVDRYKSGFACLTALAFRGILRNHVEVHCATAAADLSAFRPIIVMLSDMARVCADDMHG